MSNNTNLAKLARVIGTGTNAQVLTSQGGSSFSFADATGGGSSMTVYTGLIGTDGTPSGSTYIGNVSSPSVGDMAFASDTGIVYVRSSTGWRKIATLQEAPTAITNGDGSTLTAAYPNAGGSAYQDVALKTTDPEGFPVTWTYAVSGGGVLSGADINNSSGTKLASIAVQTAAATSGGATTITYRVTRNSTTDVAGAFTLTFTATDTQSAGASQGAVSFTISFQVSNSRYTSLLMNVNSAGTNSTFTDSNTQVTAKTITASGDPTQGSFSPYRNGGYAVEFDGSDYLKVADSNDFHVSSSADFTLEAWVYLTNLTANNQLVDTRPSGGNGDYFTVAINTSNKIYMYSQSATKVTSAASVPLNQWVHVSYVRASNTGRWYINGTADTNTWTDNIPYHTSATGADWWIGTRQGSAGSWFNDAKIRDFRFVNGTAIVPPSGGPAEPLTAVTNTKLLACSLPYLGDASATPKVITVSGDPKTVPNGPYDYKEANADDGGSIHFDGNDYLALPNSSDFTFDGDFTAECWAYIAPQSANYAALLGFSSDGEGVGWNIFASGSSLLKFHFNVAMQYTDTTTLVPHNTWCHLALVRYGTGSGNVKLYINGVADATTRTTNATATCPQNPALGATPSNTSTIVRHVSNTKITDARIVKGTALYTSNFTPPTQPLAAITSTKLLVSGQGAKVFDKSQTVNLALYGGATGHATTKIANAFSVEFDGADDYISLNNQGIANFGTEDFTAECWFNPDDIGNYRNIMGTRINSGDNTAWSIAFDATGKIYVYSNAFIVSSGTGVISPNTWYYVSYSRDGANHRLHLGTSTVSQVATATTVRNYTADNFAIGRHAYSASEYFNGNIQNLRITKGLARYSASSYTAPTTLWKG